MIPQTLYALPLLLLIGSLAWLYAYRRENVNIVDSLWSLFFLLASTVYLLLAETLTTPALLLYGLVLVWALRLSLHLLQRNAGKPEDRRYAAMRAANPKFARHSLVTVFMLQATLAWLISMPLATAMLVPTEMNAWHIAGLLVFGTGFAFETVADWQLSRFKNDPDNQGKVLDQGLWRYSRHPNYFGEAVIWWGFYLFAVAGDVFWTVYSPVLMTFLLLRVSGVTLLEKDIHERRPGYRDYIASTPAFFPWWPKHKTATQVANGERS